MAITFRCPTCKSVLAAPDGAGGTKVGCARGQTLVVPAPAAPTVRFRLNWWKRLAIVCWTLGSCLVLIPGIAVYRAWHQASGMSDTSGHIVAIVAGIVLLATGGTLNSLGTGRD